jgi:hypothetical protein
VALKEKPPDAGGVEGLKDTSFIAKRHRNSAAQKSPAAQPGSFAVAYANTLGDGLRQRGIEHEVKDLNDAIVVKGAP